MARYAMMRILHLLGAAEDTGGILTVLRNLQTATAAQGLEHVVWVNAAYREVRRPALQYRVSRHLIQDSFNHLELAWRAWRSSGELRALRRREHFDILHAHGRGGFLVALALATLERETVVFTNHGYARRRGLYRFAAGRRNLLTCLLTPNMARHYGLQPGAPNLHIISACCADDFFTRPLVRSAPVSGDGPVRLIGLGNIVGWKNWHLVLEALARLPAAERRRLVFEHWGPVPAEPESLAYDVDLKQILARHGLVDCCHFRGLSLNVEEPLRAADWFVLPSTNEPCSVALIEALALGLPAVVSASGGNVDIVRAEKTGLFFEPDNVASLAACLGRLARGEVSMLPPAEIRETVRERGATAVAAAYARVYAQARTGGASHR
jgi:glycosyltransferase involved in cell wall biosynthesis